jgi:F-type H+-transporting ATPase subunit b
MQNLLVFAAEAGHEENGAILPHDINEVIWGSIAFLIVITLIIWKGGPAIKNMWNGRIERIQGELDDAESARRQAEAKLTDVEQRIANADQERARIRGEADQTATSLAQQIAERAQREAEEIRHRAALDVETSKAQAGADLQAEIAGLAIEAAEQVIAQNLDDATQRQLVENYISNVATAPRAEAGT